MAQSRPEDGQLRRAARELVALTQATQRHAINQHGYAEGQVSFVRVPLVAFNALAEAVAEAGAPRG